MELRPGRYSQPASAGGPPETAVADVPHQVRPLRAAVIGLGVGEQHIAGYRRHPACEVAVLCDTSPQRRNEVSRRHPDLRIVADPEAGLPKLALGDAVAGQGDYDYAAYAIRRGLDRVNDLARALESRRNLFSNQAELERLIYSLRNHVRQNPASGDARFLLGYYHHVAGQHDHATRSFDQALTIDPGDRHAALLRDLTRSAHQ